MTVPKIKKEEEKLDYIFKVICGDVSVWSGVLKVRNPEVIRVSFNKYAIYYGMQADLEIETFELAEFNTRALVEVWEKDETSLDDFADSFYLGVDGDVVTKTVTFDYPLDRLSEFDEGDEYEFYVTIKVEELGIEYRQEEQIMVALDYV